MPKIEVDVPRMSRRFYLETTSSGKEQFVSIRRSRSHHHHHSHHDHGHHHHQHHRHHDRDYYKVGIDEWNRLKERERTLEETTKSLQDQVASLKKSLATAQADHHHLCHVVVPQLQNQVHVLSEDNEALRKSLDNACGNEDRHSREEERLKALVEKLEREKKELQDDNASPRDRLNCRLPRGDSCDRRELLREIDYWRDQLRYWKSKHEDTEKKHDDVCITLDIRTQKMHAYEEILKRRRII